MSEIQVQREIVKEFARKLSKSVSRALGEKVSYRMHRYHKEENRYVYTETKRGEVVGRIIIGLTKDCTPVITGKYMTAEYSKKCLRHLTK